VGDDAEIPDFIHKGQNEGAKVVKEAWKINSLDETDFYILPIINYTISIVSTLKGTRISLVY